MRTIKNIEAENFSLITATSTMALLIIWIYIFPSLMHKCVPIKDKGL